MGTACLYPILSINATFSKFCVKFLLLFLQDLCPRLIAELGEEVQDALSLLLTPLAVNYAAILYDAMKV